MSDGGAGPRGPGAAARCPGSLHLAGSRDRAGGRGGRVRVLALGSARFSGQVPGGGGSGSGGGGGSVLLRSDGEKRDTSSTCAKSKR